jgi:uncharacterized protein (TIGR01244 family)
MTLDSLVRSLPNGACPLSTVATAGQITAAQVAQIKAAGVKTIVDLRAASEPRGFDEAAVIRAAGMEYVLIAVTPVTLTDATFDQFLAVMRDPARRPILVHCASSNRVGGLLMPYFILDEKLDEKAALKLAQEAGLRSPEYASVAIDYVRRHVAKA